MSGYVFISLHQKIVFLLLENKKKKLISDTALKIIQLIHVHVCVCAPVWPFPAPRGSVKWFSVCLITATADAGSPWTSPQTSETHGHRHITRTILLLTQSVKLKTPPDLLKVPGLRSSHEDTVIQDRIRPERKERRTE